MSDDVSSGLEEGANIDRASLLKRLAIGGAALSLPSLAGAEAAFGSVQDVAASAAAVWPKHPKWKFALINHVTTNPFFVPTQYGAADAAKMLDVSYTWGGSTKADVGEMINAFNAAISAKADGIAVCVVDKGAFEAPIKRALGRGIPVVAYNADGARTGSKARQAYIGQDLYVSGFEMGKRILELVPRGDVAIFIATPGALNIQPRIDGALAAIKQSGKPVKAKAIATSPDLAQELSMIDAYYVGHKSLKGMFAVDAGDTQGVGQVIQKYKLQGKVKGGGYDLLPGHPEAHPERLAAVHHRPAAVSPGLRPRRPALPFEAVGRPRRAVGHEHRPAVRDQGQRQAVPDHEDPLPRELEQAQVPGLRVGIDHPGSRTPRRPRGATRQLRLARRRCVREATRGEHLRRRHRPLALLLGA